MSRKRRKGFLETNIKHAETTRVGTARSRSLKSAKEGNLGAGRLSSRRGTTGSKRNTAPNEKSWGRLHFDGKKNQPKVV